MQAIRALIGVCKKRIGEEEEDSDLASWRSEENRRVRLPLLSRMLLRQCCDIL
jgi:hypothetical protein